jgi:hypothetical protein
MYKGHMPIASRAAIKLLSRVSRRTNENMPSNISTNSSSYSSYCTKKTLKGVNATQTRFMAEEMLWWRVNKLAKAYNIGIKREVQQTDVAYKMSNNFTITASLELMRCQLSFQFLMVIDLSIHLEKSTGRKVHLIRARRDVAFSKVTI